MEGAAFDCPVQSVRKSPRQPETGWGRSLDENLATPKKELKTLEDKTKNHTEFLLFSVDLRRICVLKCSFLCRRPPLGMNLQVMSRRGMDLRSLSRHSNLASRAEGLGDCGSMRSRRSFLSVQGGDPIRWVGLGYRVPTISGWRPDVWLRDVLKCPRDRLIAVLPPTPPFRPRAVCVARGREAGALEGGSRRVPLDSGGRGTPKRGARGHALEPGGPSRVAGTLAPPGRAGERRAGPRGAGGPGRQWLRSGGT